MVDFLSGSTGDPRFEQDKQRSSPEPVRTEHSGSAGSRGIPAGKRPGEQSVRVAAGAVIAVVTLVDVQPITLELVPAEPERSFGDYTPGRFAWFLHNVRQLPEPVDAKGALGLWEWKANRGPIDFSGASHQLPG